VVEDCASAAKLPLNPHPTMEDFLSKLDQLIAEQDLSVIEVIGALELAKAELLADVLTEDAE
jgi:hypothetical protein